MSLSNHTQTDIQRLEKVLKIAEKNGNKQDMTKAYLDLGEAYEKNNDIKKAFQYYKEALKITGESERGDKLTNLGKNANERLSTIIARSHQMKCQNEEAIKMLEEAIQLADEAHCIELKAKAYQQLGNVFTGASEYKKAIEKYQKAREISPDFEADEMEVIANQWLGYNHLQDGQYQESIKYYNETAKLASQLKCKTRQFNANIGLASAFSNTGDFECSETYFLKAFAVAKVLNDKSLEREVYTNVGHVYCKKHEFEAAFRSYHSAKDRSRDIGDRNEEAKTWLMLGHTSRQLKKQEKTVEYYHEALNLSKELEDKEVQANAVHGLGFISFNNGNYEEALKYTEMLVQLTDEPNNCRTKQALAQKDLGMCYAYLGRYEEGLTCFKKALEIIHDLPEKDLEENINEWCGHCSCFIKDKYQEGITFYERAKEIATEVGGKYQEYRSNQAIGNILNNTGNFVKAKEYYKKAIDIAKQLSDKHCEATSCLNLASVCSKDCDYEVAKKWYEKVLNILRTEINDHLLREKALTGLGIALFNLGDTEKAIESIQEAKTFAKKETETDLYNIENTDDNINSTEQTASPSQTPGSNKVHSTRADENQASQNASSSHVQGANEYKTPENINVVTFQESDPEFKEERVDVLIEKACNPSRTEILPTEELVRLEKCIKEFPASYVYTHQASGKDPLNEKVRNSMTTNVKSSAYRNLLSTPEKRENDGKFANADQQIINFARDDLTKNESTKKPAILLRCLGPYIKSIGRISCESKVGTCWLVTDKLVITCHHVYSMFIVERLLNPNLPIEVSFDCFHARRPEDVRTVEVDEEHDPKLESSFLDYKLLRLKENEALRGRNGLGPIVRNRSLQEGLVIIVGHPAGTEEMQEETCVVVRNHSWREQLQQRHHRTGLHMTNEHLLRADRYKKQGCLPYDTTLFFGASGSPVFDMNGNIVAMHTQGYPLNVQGRQCSLMEFGVQFYAICEDMRQRKIDVEKYFPDYNLENDEERMDTDN